MYWVSREYASDVVAWYGALGAALPSMNEYLIRDSQAYVCDPPLALQDAIDSTIRPLEELDFHRSGQAWWSYADYSACEEGNHLSPLATAAARRVGKEQTMALCMIVRDEAAIVERCLAAVRPLIDAWVICDTGSTDGTQELIARTLEGVPGELHARPGIDRHHQMARKAFDQRGGSQV